MKTTVAIVHDWLVTDAGAEKVLQGLLELYPDADIFSLVDFLDQKHRKNIISNKKVHTSFIQKLPFSKSYFRNYLPLFPKAIESFDLSSYSLIISSSWAVAKGIKKSKDQSHICYCHTPIRYAWDLYEEYTKDLQQPKKFLVEKTLKYIQKWDLLSVDRVDHFIANSHFVAQRIKKTYGRDSEVIYPPIDTENFTICEEKEEFYLSVSRLVPYKKTRVIVEAFNNMPDKKLVVIGEGEEYSIIKKIAKKNIEVLGYIEKEIMVKYMQKAKGFIYAAIEDFGIVPIEAMSCGTPVIALNQGGTAETVNGNVGLHFEEQTAISIQKAVEQFEKKTFIYTEISQYAKSYSKEIFLSKIEQFISDVKR